MQLRLPEPSAPGLPLALALGAADAVRLRPRRSVKLGEHALPVDAGALHDHQLDFELGQPGGQRAAVALEAAELPTVLDDRAVGLLDQGGDHVQHAMHVDAGHAPVQGRQTFHDDAPERKVPSSTQGRHLGPRGSAGAKAPTLRRGELEDSSNRRIGSGLFTVRAAARVHGNGPGSATVGGTSQLGAGPVRRRRRASFVYRPHHPCVPPRIVPHLRGFHARGRLDRLMIG